MAEQRLQKILAQAGVASRRAAEQLITQGRVRVNGRIISELGARANPVRDRVEVDGRRLVAERPVYLLMHKPRGVVTTLDDPEGRKSIKDLLRGIPERLFPVGRLDFQTSGALLLTNDGAMAQALLHPTRAVPKTYHAKIAGTLDEKRLEALRSGVTLDDGERTAPAEVVILRQDDKHTFLQVTISEGKNRQIHRMLDAVGRVVLRLTRIAFAELPLESLRAGQMRPLTTAELGDLKEKYLNPSKKAARARRARGYANGPFSDEELVQPGPFDEQDEEPPRSREPASRAAAGREPARRDAAGREPARRDAAGREPARRDHADRGSSPRERARRGASPAKRGQAARVVEPRGRVEAQSQRRGRRFDANASERDDDARTRAVDPRTRTNATRDARAKRQRRR